MNNQGLLNRQGSVAALFSLLLLGTASATVDCDHKVEQVLADPYNVGWKLSGWDQAKVRCSSASPCSSATNLKEQLSLLLTAASTGMRVVVRYGGGVSSCTDPAIVSGTEMGYYYRLIGN